jgi:L-cysteate sulfo-lyase
MLDRLASLPSLAFAAQPTPVESLDRLRGALGVTPQLLIKRDDTIGFAFGGNKVRKMRLVAADAQHAGADTLITAGGVQSNHARVTAAAAAKLGMRAILVVNGKPSRRPSGNALLDALLGADIRYVGSREERAIVMQQAADEVRAAGGRPYVIPVGASTALGAAAFALAFAELLEQLPAPDVIIHSTSSGGTQAGLLAGCLLAEAPTRILGISADEPAAVLEREIRGILAALGALLDFDAAQFEEVSVEIDDSYVGRGYGKPTRASREALSLLARTEAVFLDPTYTAKAMAGMIDYLRKESFPGQSTVLFWHTGGQVGLFS